MNSFFQSNSVGGMPVSPHIPRKAAVASPFSPVSHKRTNGQPEMTSSKKPREVHYNSPAPNAATLLHYWPYAPGSYQLAHSIAQMEMVTPMTPVSPIRQATIPLSPFSTPGMMYPHASPFPYYAPNYMAFHPGFANMNAGSFMPFLRPNEYSSNHASAANPPGPFGSPFRNNSPAPSNVFGNQQTASMGMRTPRHMHSPLSCKREDRSTADIMPRFNEPEDLTEDFVLPEYRPFTPRKNNQQHQMFHDEPESSSRQAFATPPQTPGTPYTGSQASNGRLDRRHDHLSNKMSAAIPVLSGNPEPSPSSSQLFEYTMKDFGIEPREVWPTDFPSMSPEDIKKDLSPLPMDDRKNITIGSSEVFRPRNEGQSAKTVPMTPHLSRNKVDSSVQKEKRPSVIGVSWTNRKIPKVEPCWSTENNFESNKENISPTLLWNQKQEAVSTAHLIPPSSNTSQRGLEHLRAYAAGTIPRALSFSMNFSSFGSSNGRRSPLKPLMETHPGSTEVRCRQAGSAAPEIQNVDNSETSTSGSIGAPSRRPSDDSTRTVPMTQRNSPKSCSTSSSKWSR